MHEKITWFTVSILLFLGAAEQQYGKYGKCACCI